MLRLALRRPMGHVLASRQALAMATGATVLQYLYYSANREKSRLEENNNNHDKESQSKTDSDTGSVSRTSLDLTKEWERAKGDLSGLLQQWNILQDESEGSKENEETSTDDNVGPPSSTDSSKGRFARLFSLGKKNETQPASPPDPGDSGFLSSLVTDVSSVLLNPSGERKEKALKNLIETAHQTVQTGDTNTQNKSLVEVFGLLKSSLDQMEQMLKGNFAHIDLSNMTLNALYYFVEYQDERKNPSWKRRMHRFHPGIDYSQVVHLNEALKLATISYADTVEEIKGLLKDYPGEMIFCETESYPGKPSHFLLLNRDQSVWSSELEVVMVVRGSKTIPDVITDCLLDAVDYRGGKVHAGILDSGKYLVDKHLDLLQTLCKSANKRKVKLTLIGHSLGAGAAAIAGMEFQDVPEMNVKVVGFGCPALLSQELSEETASYITTVINDWDLVPRMSGATVANALLDIMECDWTDKARIDTDHALRELQRVAPSVLSDSSRDYILGLVDSSLEQYVQPSIKASSSERMTPILFPPGSCIHFYHDGSGVTASVSPCTFFGEIDVTRRMVDDHLTKTGYKQVFLDLMRQHNSDQNFSFDDLKR